MLKQVLFACSWWVSLSLMAPMALAQEEEILLSECYIDQPFNEAATYFETTGLTDVRCPERCRYYRGAYDHYLLRRQKVLIIRYNRWGDVVLEREVTRDMPSSKKIYSHEIFPIMRICRGDECSPEHYRSEMTVDIEAQVTQEVSARAAIQCQ